MTENVKFVLNLLATTARVRCPTQGLGDIPKSAEVRLVRLDFVKLG
jgi:hypothetical protein